MDFPRFGGSELVQDRGSRPDRTLGEFLTRSRIRIPCRGSWKRAPTSVSAFWIFVLTEFLIWATTSVGSVGT